MGRGFLVLRLSGDQIVEEFREENGNLCWRRGGGG
jgi:hypothetical protein